MSYALVYHSAVLPAKRKRAPVSYTDLDEDDFTDSSIAAASGSDSQSADDMDSDFEYAPGVRASSSRKGRKRLKKQVGSAGAKHEPQNVKPFPFLTLPAELRDMIYEMALGDADDMTLISRTKGYRRAVIRACPSHNCEARMTKRDFSRSVHGDNQRKCSPSDHASLMPNLLATNKQIRDEASGFLYSRPIVFDDTYTLHTFLANIGPINRLRLANIKIKDWGCGRGTHKAMNHSAMAMLSTCTNLKSINFACKFDYYRRTPQALARLIFRNCHVFLEAYGAARGERYAGVQVLKVNKDAFGRGMGLDWVHRLEPSKNMSYAESKNLFEEELCKLLDA